jgi:hypothetical protein
LDANPAVCEGIVQTQPSRRGQDALVTAGGTPALQLVTVLGFLYWRALAATILSCGKHDSSLLRQKVLNPDLRQKVLGLAMKI